MNWIKNEGKTSKPPTQDIVHIQLSETNEQHPDGIWLYQNPYDWDWLSQSCIILKWSKP